MSSVQVTSGAVPPGMTVGSNQNISVLSGRPTKAGHYVVSGEAVYESDDGTWVKYWSVTLDVLDNPPPLISPVASADPSPVIIPSHKPTSTPNVSVPPVSLPPFTSPGQTPIVVVSLPPAATPTPTAPPADAPVITKQPTKETVVEGGSATFVAAATGYAWCAWRFISPDGNTEVIFDVVGDRFPGLKITGGNNPTLRLDNIPIQMNGWKAVCLFSSATNKWTYTDGSAVITVNAAATATPEVTPTPTPTAEPTPTPTAEPTATPEPTAVPAAVTETATPEPTAAPEPPKSEKKSPIVPILIGIIVLLVIAGVTAVLLMRRKTQKSKAQRFCCDKCGWAQRRGESVPKYCPNCGDEFDYDDIVR